MEVSCIRIFRELKFICESKKKITAVFIKIILNVIVLWLIIIIKYDISIIYNKLILFNLSIW